MAAVRIEIIEALAGHGNRVVLADTEREYTASELLSAADRVAGWLLGAGGGPSADLAETRVAFMIPAGFEYVATLLGIWQAGGVAVPLCVSHPAPELAHVLDDTGTETVIVHPGLADGVAGVADDRGLRVALTTETLAADPTDSPHVPGGRRALILYTSGTTGHPKGVVMTHDALAATIGSLVEAWGWEPDDRILHVLPLHHTHGIVNALLCALWVGATCEMRPAFNAAKAWDRFGDERVSVFMAVPTIYRRLMQAWEEADAAERERMTAAASSLRLMVSGSAALPVPLFERWREVGGHTLLERYGMTEVGMALSSPLHGERRAGTVGVPLPGVEVRLVDDGGEPIEAENEQGEIEVRGPGLFREYWGHPDHTSASFRDDWFRTGDQAIVEDGRFRILGRRSVDIIKTGGYKVSALEIEGVLGGHPDVSECAVVGVADEEWGEAVCVAVVGRQEIDQEALREWARERMARYKIPGRVRQVSELPRNAMGKVNKPRIQAWFQDDA